jgi:hypothetical protein
MRWFLIYYVRKCYLVQHKENQNNSLHYSLEPLITEPKNRFDKLIKT